MVWVVQIEFLELADLIVIVRRDLQELRGSLQKQPMSTPIECVLAFTLR